MLKFGLDFGTTNSSISLAQNGVSQVLPVDMAGSDPRVVRSMLFFFRRELSYKKNIPRARITNQNFMLGDIEYKGEFKSLIGQEAVNQYLDENKNRKPGIKRTIFTGRWLKMRSVGEATTVAEPEHYEETDYGTGRLLQALKSSLRTSFKGTSVFGKYFTVEELVGRYVREIKEKAEESLGHKIEELIIGRPVYFSDDPKIDQKAQNRLAVAIKETGIKSLKFEFEPVAAAKQFSSRLKGKNLSLVFDFGGGTLDTAIVRTDGNFQVLATDGVYIGGDLLNADIMQAKLWDYFGAEAKWGINQLDIPLHLYHSLKSWYSIPSLNNPDTLALLERIGYKNSDTAALERFIYLIKTNVGFELYESIEQAKKELSLNPEARIIFNDGPINLNMRVTREEFEEIIEPRVKEVREVVLRTLKKAQLEPGQIDIVVKTGGSSLIPVFEKMLEDIFGKEKITQFETFTSIAAGLALD